MLSKFFTPPIVLLVLTSSVNADAFIAPGLGVPGTQTPTSGDVQHLSTPGCGGISIAGNLDTSTHVQAATDRTFAVTITNFASNNAKGSRHIKSVQVNAAGDGNTFVPATMVTNGDSAPSDTTSQQLKAQLPDGIQCTGGSDKDCCLVSFITDDGAGNCVVVKPPPKAARREQAPPPNAPPPVSSPPPNAPPPKSSPPPPLPTTDHPDAPLQTPDAAPIHHPRGQADPNAPPPVSSPPPKAPPPKSSPPPPPPTTDHPDAPLQTPDAAPVHRPRELAPPNVPPPVSSPPPPPPTTDHPDAPLQTPGPAEAHGLRELAPPNVPPPVSSPPANPPPPKSSPPPPPQTTGYPTDTSDQKTGPVNNPPNGAGKIRKRGQPLRKMARRV